jgi:hypothetical protein
MTSRGERDAQDYKKLYSSSRQCRHTIGVARKPAFRLQDIVKQPPNRDYQRTSRKRVTVPSVKFLKDNS